jgi:hypothetical protein
LVQLGGSLLILGGVAFLRVCERPGAEEEHQLSQRSLKTLRAA